MTTTARVAAIQINSNDDEAHNWARTQALAAEARERGARLIAFPENLLYEGPDHHRPHALEEWEPRFAGLAKELEVVLVAGSIHEPAGDKHYNTTLVYGPEGTRLARYRKQHLFDVDVPGGPNERESDRIVPGELGPTVIDLPGIGPTGFAICYDLRFPEVTRTLALKGADLVAHPTNFPVAARIQTELITVARAAENRIYLLTANRVGVERTGEFCGWSQIVDPYGKRLAEADESEETLLVAEVDVGRARDKDYVVPGEYELYLFGHRRPELYGALVEEMQGVTT